MLDYFIAKTKKNKVKIFVIGDIVLDQYYDVKITRISPESPNVSIMLSQDDSPLNFLGGAGNVPFQLKNFNVDIRLFGFLDESCVEVCDKSKSVYISAGANPKKKRFMDGNTQVTPRWDIESPLYGLTQQELCQAQSALGEKIKSHLKKECPEVVIFSDYGKGVFERTKDSLNRLIGKEKLPICIVDPKNKPIEKWRGRCDVFKPNSVEAQNLSGRTSWKEQCDFFEEIIECHSVVITQQGNGVVGKSKGEYFEYRPRRKVIANKISGAGDCFVGILGMAIGLGFPIPEASEIAFEVGAFFVQQNISEPVNPKFLTKYVCAKDLEARDFKLAMTNGCYDYGLTKGHVECFKFAKTQGDKLLVAINSDESVKRLKGCTRPLMGIDERMAVVAACQEVDFVISFSEDTPIDLIRKILPDVIVKGSEYKKEDVVGYGLSEVVLCPMVPCLSTSEKIRLTT